MLSRRNIILAVICFIIIAVVYDNRDVLPATLPLSSSPGSTANKPSTKGATFPVKSSHLKDAGGKPSPLSPEVLNYFDQTFSESPRHFEFPAIRQTCAQSKWPERKAYLQCGAMSAGLTSIMSELKVCFKMAIDARVGIVLPAMPLRDSTDLTNFNFMNGDAFMTYDRWFDADFLISQMKHACPQLSIIHPDQLEKGIQVKNRWDMDLGKIPGFQGFSGFFWVGKSFHSYFEEEWKKLEDAAAVSPDRDDSNKGITIVTVAASFLLFKISDDPTGNELRLWNDLATIIRFRPDARAIVASLLSKLTRPFYGVHFRAEADTIWSSPDHQLAVDLDALDQAWKQYGKPGQEKPLVYLACGDQGQVDKFVAAGKERGWDVTHKWALARDSAETTKMINDLAFDFQGAVDLGIMVRSHFFFGITGSAFSSTVSNARDVTGRYRGSSLTVFDDGNARTHLFNDGDAGGYPCCL